MGFWKTGRGIGGDSWADAMGRCMKEIVGNRATFRQDASGGESYGPEGHEITLAEFADLVEFCSLGHLTVEVTSDFGADRPLSELHTDGVKTIPNRGQMHRPEESPAITP